MDKLCDIFIRDKDYFNEIAPLVDNTKYLEEQEKVRKIFGFPIAPDKFSTWKEQNAHKMLTEKQDKEFTEWFCQLKLPSISKHINNYDNLQWVKEQEKIFSPPVALEKAAIHLYSYFSKNWEMFRFIEMAIATNVIQNEEDNMPILTLYAPNVHFGNIDEIKHHNGDLFRIPENISFALFFHSKPNVSQLIKLLKEKLPELEKDYEEHIAKYRRWSTFRRKAKLENARSLYKTFLEIQKQYPKFSKEKCYEQIVIEEELSRGRDPHKLDIRGNTAIDSRKDQIKKAVETYRKILEKYSSGKVR